MAQYTSLKAKLFAAALLNPGLVYLLGGGSPLVLRWFDVTLPQYVNAATFPAVVVTLISNPSNYALGGRLPTSFTRMQFTVYGTGTDSQNADAVVEALSSFLDTFNADGITNRIASPNYIVNDRDMGIAQTQPLTYMRVVDARIYDNSTV
jgi:hypothetical protein